MTKTDTAKSLGQRHFPDRDSWRAWLEKNHASCRGIWLVFFKKHTGRSSISYDAAVEEALCFGWIDSLIRRLDEDRFARKFTPRTDTTKWSAANLRRVRNLMDSGRMTAAGRKKIAVDAKPLPAVSSRPLEPPPFVAAALSSNPAAATYFASLAASCRRDYLHWITSAKRESTRKRRLDQAIAMLAAGKKPGMK